MRNNFYHLNIVCHRVMASLVKASRYCAHEMHKGWLCRDRHWPMKAVPRGGRTRNKCVKNNPEARVAPLRLLEARSVSNK